MESFIKCLLNYNPRKHKREEYKMAEPIRNIIFREAEEKGARIGFSVGLAFGTLLGIAIYGAIDNSLDNNTRVTKDSTYLVENKESVCIEALAPLRRDFIKKCTLENFENGTVLEDIAVKGNQIINQYGCEPQVWKCRPLDPSKTYDPGSKFKVEFNYK